MKRKSCVAVEGCSTVVWIMQTDRVLAWEALTAIVTFYSAICIVGTRIVQLSHNEHAMPWEPPCHQHTSVQPALFMSTGP